MSSSSSRPPPSKRLELDITIISAKHIKNTNWRHGDLKPYVSFWLEPGRRFTTKPDDSGSTRPVWNEHFVLPINSPLDQTFLSLEISHSDSPTPLVGSLQFPLNSINPNTSNSIYTLELRRPSGRPQGKIRLKLAFREHERPPPPQYLGYTPATPPIPTYTPSPAPPNYKYAYYDALHGPCYLPTSDNPKFNVPQSPLASSPPYYSGYYSHPTLPPQARSFSEIPSGPSAPVDYSSYDRRGTNGSKMGLGTGLVVGSVAGALGGLTLDEGNMKYEEDKVSDGDDLDYRRYL